VETATLKKRYLVIDRKSNRAIKSCLCLLAALPDEYPVVGYFILTESFNTCFLLSRIALITRVSRIKYLWRSASSVFYFLFWFGLSSAGCPSLTDRQYTHITLKNQEYSFWNCNFSSVYYCHKDAWSLCYNPRWNRFFI